MSEMDRMSGNRRRRTKKTKEELEKEEDDLFNKGPLSLLTTSVESNTPVLVKVGRKRKLFGHVKGFDRFFNMAMEDVTEMWTVTRGGETVKKERFMSKLFVRGDSVVMVVKNPTPAAFNMS